MGHPVQAYAPAYVALEAIARERFGAPLHSFEIFEVLNGHPDTRTEFEKISKELDAGLGHDPDTIAGRLNMPAGFVAALLFCARNHSGVGFIRIETVEWACGAYDKKVVH